MNRFRLLAIAQKELLQLRRDRLTLAMMVGIPVMQLLLFGFAINTDVRHMPTLVWDQDRQAEGRDLVQKLFATGFYDFAGQAQSHADIERSFREGQARVAVVIPQGFAAQLNRREATQLQLVVDGTDPQVVGSATNAATGALGQWSAQRARQRGLPSAPALGMETSILYNPELRTAVYVVPGLVAIILTMTMVMLTAMAIARERERGTLELLIVSPVKNLELMAGKILPYVVIGYVQITLVLLLGATVFRVPLRGSLPLLYAVSFAFIAGNLALGLVFSTAVKTQQQAMQLSFFFLLPNILLSGFMFPWEGMPAPIRWLSQLLPATHFLRIVRGILLKGAGFSEIQGELWWMCLILFGLVGLAAARFQKTLD